MIEVEHLTKRYSGITALDDISFHVQKGEIVGFLGPNGAGKSTTMRILSGFMPPSSGRVSVAGYDVCRESLKAREHVGYMPENVPLYQEMRVVEYLRYRAALKGVRGRKVKERVSDVIELCALNDVSRKLIGTLSKGYRQRVGLADAMVHEPDLLILDEPTIGLDPNQIRQVRDLIRNLARHHTILLSSHILSEVELTCHRVIIINKGKIEALDTPQNLRQRLRSGGDIRLEISVPNPETAAAQFKTLSGVQSATWETKDAWQFFQLQVETDTDPREALFAHCVAQGWKVRELALTRTSLEDVFVEMTQPE